MKKIYFLVESAKKIDIEKNEAIDLLTEKIDFNSLELCDKLNLHYNHQLLLVKIDHFSAYGVWSGICQKKIFFLVIESAAVKRLLSEIFYRIEVAVKKEKFINLFCSTDVIQIDSGRLPLGKITCFKNVAILFDGLDEVICHDYKKVFVNAHIYSSKVLLPSSF